MPRILVTGMSGTGKSTALAELERKGFRVVDTDSPDWSEWVPPADGAEGEWLWREDRIADLLASKDERTLFVSGTHSNQGKFYDRFDAVVLLSAGRRPPRTHRKTRHQPVREGSGRARAHP